MKAVGNVGSPSLAWETLTHILFSRSPLGYSMLHPSNDHWTSSAQTEDLPEAKPEAGVFR